MICVSCKESMLALELGGLEIDYCDNCGGIWLDSGELEQVLGERDFREDQLIPLEMKSTSEKSERNCPICSKRMSLVSITESETKLDRCERGHGIWFDRGELQQVAKAISLEDSDRVTDLLANMFDSGD